MESFIFFATVLFAVLDAFAFARNSEHLTLVAELTFADLDPTFVFVCISKLRSSDLDDNDLIPEVIFSNRQLAPHVGLHRFTRELDTRVFFILGFYYTKKALMVDSNH